MQRMLAVLIACVFLTSCAEIRAGGSRVEQTVEREIALSKDKLDYYFDPDRRVIDKPPQEFPSRYCYKNFGDIVCYKDPLPNARTRLVGYQEPGTHYDWNDAVGTAPKDPTHEYRMRSTFNPWKNESGTESIYVKRFPKDEQHATIEGSPTVVTVPPPVRVTECETPSTAEIIKPDATSAKKSQKSFAVKKQPKKRSAKKRARPSRECLVYADEPQKTTRKRDRSKPSGSKDAAKKPSAATPKATDAKPSTTGATSAATAPAAAPATVPEVTREVPKVMVERPDPVPVTATPTETKPADTQTAPVKRLRDLEEIKYDPDVATPQPLLENPSRQ